MFIEKEFEATDVAAVDDAQSREIAPPTRPCSIWGFDRQDNAKALVAEQYRIFRAGVR